MKPVQNNFPPLSIVASSITVRSYTFVEIDHEMISKVILLPSADSFKKGCCHFPELYDIFILSFPLGMD